jgi:hypothetical protein
MVIIGVIIRLLFPCLTLARSCLSYPFISGWLLRSTTDWMMKRPSIMTPHIKEVFHGIATNP